MLLPVRAKSLKLEAIQVKVDEITDECDKKTANQIDNMIEDAKSSVSINFVKAVNLLFYFERTKRFREIGRFKKSTFQDYLFYGHGIKYHQYDGWKKALKFYPAEVIMLGLPQVNKVRNKCGDMKAKIVFDEIKNASKNNNVIDQGKIDEIVSKYSNPKEQPYKETYGELQQKYDQLMIQHREVLKQNAELLEQVKKLKNTVEKYKKIVESIKKTVV